jgi:hypothetical protein
LDILRLLLNGGASIRRRDANRDLPIYLAVRNFSTDLRKAIVGELVDWHLKHERIYGDSAKAVG